MWLLMKNIIRLRLPVVASLAAAASVALILLAGTACQSKKSAKGPELVGDKVNMTELRQAIQTKIPDPSRASALMNVVGHAESELGAINEGYVKHIKKFAKASANHSKDANDLHLILREWDNEAGAQRRRLTDLLFSMRSNTTPEEWPHITNAFLNSVKRQSDRYNSLN